MFNSASSGDTIGNGGANGFSSGGEFDFSYDQLINMGKYGSIDVPGSNNEASGGFLSNFFGNALGRTDEHGYQQGWAGTALKTFGGLASAYLGMKQYGLAKDVFKENKKQFNLNYDATRQTTNAQLRDRQIARVETGNSGYQSVGEYMPQNEIAQRTA